jgi:uncharacterized protein (DUF433 family)
MAGLKGRPQPERLPHPSPCGAYLNAYGGRPCIRGFRIPVSDVLELLSSGAPIDEILADYSFLEREDVLAAIEYAAHQANHPVLKAP